MESQEGKKYFRTIGRVKKDGIFTMGYRPEGIDVRKAAILEVLRRLPERDYKLLLEKSDKNEFQWFVPGNQVRGSVSPFSPNIFGKKVGDMVLAPYAQVIFLSPILEDKDSGSVAETVAHELAHIILGHGSRFTIMSIGFLPDLHREEATDNKVIEWGFKEEEPPKHFDFGHNPERQDLMQEVAKAQKHLGGMSRSEVDAISEDEASKLAQGVGIILEVITGNSKGKL